MAEKINKSNHNPIMLKPANAKGKNKKIKASFAVIAILLIATVAALAVMIVTKNLFGGRDVILDFLTSKDPSYVTLQEWKNSLEALQEELTSREESLIKKEAVLVEEKAELEAKAEAIKNEEIISSFELYVESLSDERISQFVQLGTIYSNMDTKQAAAAISEIGSEIDMAIVIYYMKPEYSAGVLDCMDPELAAQITESLLK